MPLPALRRGLCGPVHIGIDSGSTTIKLVVIDQNASILFESYRPNLGNPIPLVKETLLQKLYDEPSRPAGGRRDHHRLRRGTRQKRLPL